MPDGTIKNESWELNVLTPTKNLTKATEYADTFALFYNPVYGPPFDADCTNFISQILHDSTGGGFPMEDGNGDPTHNWYFYSKWYYSNTWTVVTEFYKYMEDYKGIVDLSVTGTEIYINGYGTYTTPPLLNAGVIRFQFPNEPGDPIRLHNVFTVKKGKDVDGWWNNVGEQPMVDYHSSYAKHVNWSLVPRNKDWADTLVTVKRIKWDY